MNKTMKLNVTSSIGFLIGIGAWSISFITLIWGYLFYRMRAGQWLGSYMDEAVYIKIIINSALLIFSSWLFHQFLQEKRNVMFWGGIFSGSLFLEEQWRLWEMLLARGLTLKGSLAGSFLYLLTGFHAAHVLIGLVILLAFSIKLLVVSEQPHDDQGFQFGLKFWDLLLFFWLVLVFLIFILK